MRGPAGAGRGRRSAAQPTPTCGNPGVLQLEKFCYTHFLVTVRLVWKPQEADHRNAGVRAAGRLQAQLADHCGEVLQRLPAGTEAGHWVRGVNAGTVLGLVTLLFGGILAGEEFTIRYGVRAAVA